MISAPFLDINHTIIKKTKRRGRYERIRLICQYYNIFVAPMQLKTKDCLLPNNWFTQYEVYLIPRSSHLYVFFTARSEWYLERECIILLIKDIAEGRGPYSSIIVLYSWLFHDHLFRKAVYANVGSFQKICFRTFSSGRLSHPIVVFLKLYNFCYKNDYCFYYYV